VHDDRQIVEGRLGRALRQLIRPAIRRRSVPLRLEAWHVPGEPVPVRDALHADYAPIGVGEMWGPPWSTTWFRATGHVPEEWSGLRVEAVFDLGHPEAGPGFQAEALAYDAEGIPLKGINPRTNHVPIANPAGGGEQVVLLLEAAANPDILADGFVPTRLGDRSTAGDEPLYRITRADLAVLDEQVWHLHIDTLVLSELMAQLAVSDPRRHEILRSLERMLDALDPDDISGSASAARAELAETLARPAHASAHVASAVGHAHIDTAWLWPVRETVRKCARTFANVTALAADYPELVFACSQAQQLEWMKLHHPLIFERIAEAAKAGRWVPVGGMWVEADANLPGGEALVRQLVLGKRLFLDELGVECREVWLPDSFGYSAAFPQIARLAGSEFFLTQKLSWNQVNRLPHHTFWWEGIDGSRVFTHFPPVDTYNSELSGEELAHAVANYADKGRGTRSLVPFGHGDGGGGPTREMLERARRLADLEGSPRVVIEEPSEFFAAALAEYPDAPVWVGELYLELHRATFTSQARTKAGNRRSEHLLREAELWATTGMVHAGLEYPHGKLTSVWKRVLLNQFHDILPGSSIAWVHHDAEATYAGVRTELEEIISTAITAVAGSGDTPWVFNAAPHRRIVAPGAVSVAAMAATPGGKAVALAPVVVTPRSIDNGLVRVELDDDGLMSSIRDVAHDREVVPPGSRANLLQLHTDIPNQWDAWDIDAHYRRRRLDLVGLDEMTVVEGGPDVGAIRLVRSFGRSHLTQTIRLEAGARRIDVATEIDWHEQEKILKAAFPIDVRADRSAAEIQFGHVFRPTHTNTSWEAARFENYAHRWVHVAEPGFGLAVLNDSTYGHDITRATRPDGGTTTTVRLSLVRAPRCPDPEADQGRHTMTYAIAPGADIVEAVREGMALNLPVRTVPGADRPAPAPIVAVDDPAVVVEAVKAADDRSGDVIVRLYEAAGGRARPWVTPGFQSSDVEVVDLLERPLADPGTIEATTGRVRIDLRPFQIVTLRFRR
jgi:alpha-mannosidase